MYFLALAFAPYVLTSYRVKFPKSLKIIENFWPFKILNSGNLNVSLRFV